MRGLCAVYNNWSEEAVEDGVGPCEGVEKGQAFRHFTNGAGKNTSVSSSHFCDVNHMEIEEEVSTMPTTFWAE